MYEKRPITCREYRCAVLLSLADGSLTKAQAEQLIQESVKLKARVQREVSEFLGVRENLPFPILLRRLEDKVSKMERGDRNGVSPKMLLDVGTLHILLKNRFYPQNSGLEKDFQSSEL